MSAIRVNKKPASAAQTPAGESGSLKGSPSISQEEFIPLPLSGNLPPWYSPEEVQSGITLVPKAIRAIKKSKPVVSIKPGVGEVKIPEEYVVGYAIDTEDGTKTLKLTKSQGDDVSAFFDMLKGTKTFYKEYGTKKTINEYSIKLYEIRNDTISFNNSWLLRLRDGDVVEGTVLKEPAIVPTRTGDFYRTLFLVKSSTKDALDTSNIGNMVPVKPGMIVTLMLHKVYGQELLKNWAMVKGSTIRIKYTMTETKNGRKAYIPSPGDLAILRTPQ